MPRSNRRTPVPEPEAPPDAGRPRRLTGFLVVAGAGVVLFLALGMHRGVLLSNDIKAKCWPWAPSYPRRPIPAVALSDPVWQFVPWLGLARKELLAARLPLWNPHQDGGVPLLGNGQSALGSPLLFPALLLGVAHGWNLTLLARLLVALAGAYLWLRDRGRSTIAASLGALAFALSGAFVAWLEHPHTLVAAPVPLLLLFAGRAAERPAAKSIAGLAVATALVLLGGHPETAILAALLTVGVVLVRARSPRGVASSCGAALLGVGLAAPFLFPFTEYYAISSARLGVDRHPFVLPLSAIVRFLFPKDPGSHPIEAAATVSVAVLVLAPFSFGRLRRDREAAFFALTAIACLLVAYENPLSRLLAKTTPIYWSRVLLLLPLALGYLGSLGLDRLVARSGGRPAARLAAALLIAAAGVELIFAARGVHSVTPRRDLLTRTPILDRLAEDRELFHVLPLHTFLPANTATQYGLDDLRGYDALAPHSWRVSRRAIGRFGNMPSQIDVVEPWDLAPGGEALDLWSVKYLLLHPQFQFGAEMLNRRMGLDLVEVYSGADGKLLLNRRARPRVRWIGSPPAAISVRQRVATRWSVSVDAPSAGRLLVADPSFPGWASRVDEKWSPIDSPYGTPMEVTVPAGHHEVTLAYRPVSFRLGIAACALSLLLLATWCIRGKATARAAGSGTT
jgi:hypothetical protein